MGYVVPPSLPDYSKLIQYLNSSGVQKWNPAVYDILSQLIAAVKQSQDVLVGTTIPSSFNGVSVDPAGALSGNGLSSSPLAVKVDGTTISINGSDQLTSSVVSEVFFASGTTPFVTILPNSSATINAHTIFATIVAVPGRIIWPLATYVTSSQVISGGGGTGAWNSGISYEAVWNGTFSGYTGPIFTGSHQIFNTNLATTRGTQLFFPTGAQTATSASDAFKNTDFNLRTANAANVNGSTNATGTMVNSGTWSIIYTLL